MHFTRYKNLTYESLPNPETRPEFYENVTMKRLLAFFIDTVLIFALSAILSVMTLFIGFLFFPIVVLIVSLIYRIGFISMMSATPGMKLCHVELRNFRGETLTQSEAALHTIGYMVASLAFLPQLASFAMMLMTSRGQGLHDLLAGVVAVNTPSHA